VTVTQAVIMSRLQRLRAAVKAMYLTLNAKNAKAKVAMNVKAAMTDAITAAKKAMIVNVVLGV
jgi:hypothetical protein